MTRFRPVSTLLRTTVVPACWPTVPKMLPDALDCANAVELMLRVRAVAPNAMDNARTKVFLRYMEIPCEELRIYKDDRGRLPYFFHRYEVDCTSNRQRYRFQCLQNAKPAFDAAPLTRCTTSETTHPSAKTKRLTETSHPKLNFRETFTYKNFSRIHVTISCHYLSMDALRRFQNCNIKFWVWSRLEWAFLQ
jgi:hypothetical protein